MSRSRTPPLTLTTILSLPLFLSPLLLLPFLLLPLLPGSLCAAQTQPPLGPIPGDWQGTLNAGGAQLRLVLHISTAPGRTLHATLDSVDQGADGIPVSAITFKDNALNLTIAAVHGSYTGTLGKGGDEIDGTWTQGAALPLNFKRAAGSTQGAGQPALQSATAAAPRRPQNPVRPYPYREEFVTYTNPLQHDTLAATLTIPPGKGPFPAVLLILGSGPHDRDETLLGHKPFLVLSDYLTRHGIVVLRADDRGVGKSTGDFATATTADFATDTEAGVAFLKTRPEVDPHRVGLIGHSEGAVIAAMVAARDHDVDFIVMMAGSGVPGAQVIAEQSLLLAEASGVPADTAEKNAAIERALLALAATEKDPAALEKELRAQLAGLMPEAQIEPQIKTLTSPWFRYFLSYDPATALRQVHCPVLVLNGSKDLQVSPAQNLPAIRKALQEAGNTHVQIDELPGLNHLFQTATTGSPGEYARIEETIAPLALETISNWVLQQR